MRTCPKCGGEAVVAKMLPNPIMIDPLSPRWAFLLIGGLAIGVGAWSMVETRGSAPWLWAPLMLLGSGACLWVFTPWRRKAEARMKAQVEWVNTAWVCKSCGAEVA